MLHELGFVIFLQTPLLFIKMNVGSKKKKEEEEKEDVKIGAADLMDNGMKKGEFGGKTYSKKQCWE